MGSSHLTGNAQIDDLIQRSRVWLEQRGESLVGSGSFRGERVFCSLHTDFGPPALDKGANQDYVLAWRPRKPEFPTDVRLALAIGDGLTSSLNSEMASALACWIGLRTLVEGDGAAPPKERAQNAFDAVGQAIRDLVKKMNRRPEASCPPGQYLSTWKYILKKGLLFETTLLLAWTDGISLRTAMVGDGGVYLREYEPRDPVAGPRDSILTRCDLDTNQVQALGPNADPPPAIGFWFEGRLERPFLLALCTDGLVRGFRNDAKAVLDGLEALHATGVDNQARHFIAGQLEKSPERFDDNLTLVTLRLEKGSEAER